MSFNKNKVRGFALVFIILSLILPLLSIPYKTMAIFGVGDIVFDPTNTVQTTITASNTSVSSFSQLSVQFKEYVLDGLGTMVVKQIVRQITTSVVGWINSGFEGSPSFVQNPGAEFLDIADQITGDFIAKKGGPLADLCDPFSIDIRLALAFQYRPYVQKKYECTLGSIIKNTQGAVENASINGFTAGDFKQGGWPAFVSLTTEPQNNIYGAYITAKYDLAYRVATAEDQKKEEISAGRGFLSWRDPKCAAEVREHNKKIEEDHIGDAQGDTEGGEQVKSLLRNKNDCPVQTPGSVIQGSLQNSLDGPLRELELADEINEVVNALFAQLVTQVLQAGLGSVSSKDSSGSSYLDRTVTDLNSANSPQVQAIKTELLDNINAGKKNAIEYKQVRDEALTVMLEAKNAYDSVKACYNEKINAVPQELTTGEIQTAQSRMAEIDTIISTSIAPKSLNLLTLAQQADTRLKTLEDMLAQVTVAKTLNDLNGPSRTYSEMLQTRTLVTAIDIQNAKEDLEQARNDSAELKQDALRKSQQCQLLN